MKDRIVENQFKGALIFLLFIVLTLISIFSDAQSISDINTYAGFRAGFGTHAITVSSDIQEIDRIPATLGGGNIGVIFGGKAVRTSLGLFGYYSTVCQGGGTIDLYTTDASVNLFPLSLLTDKNFRLQPYVSGGLALASYKFYGYYLNSGREPVNYSVTREPHLGTLNQLSASFGTGIVVNIIDDHQFVHFFSEVRYSQNMGRAASNKHFDNTRIQDGILFSAGFSFGAKS